MSKDEKIIVHSSTKNLVLIRKFIEEQALKLGFDENVINQIILAVDEACTNIMKYSHSFNEENTIQICTKLIGDDFKIQIKYNGKKFRPEQYTKS